MQHKTGLPSVTCSSTAYACLRTSELHDGASTLTEIPQPALAGS